MSPLKPASTAILRMLNDSTAARRIVPVLRSAPVSQTGVIASRLAGSSKLGADSGNAHEEVEWA